ncbi:MAE_28990/MAE_18760 family HEPN-like nuclease [Pacificispira sp.]|uniref:MAE_28990/MAE_18760 family HEPN-like nuclease n=1 Tax=Pacificispira sp. TaxID=2888761 RepID=UPI003BAA5D00
MSKPISAEDFSNQITNDRTWRIKEISDLKAEILRSDKNLQRVLLRAIVAVCYAHWEGFVRFSARKYLEHIALRRLQYSELSPQFLKNYFLPKLAALSKTKSSITQRCDLLDDIFSSSGRRFSKLNEDLINTKSNLNYDVLCDICLVCDVDCDVFERFHTFIDVVLLKRRNAIAHGEDTMVGLEDLSEVADNTIAIMRMFGDALENDVVLKNYVAA